MAGPLLSAVIPIAHKVEKRAERANDADNKHRAKDQNDVQHLPPKVVLQQS
jgi:hypothetical protein